jgi:Quinohemoprotein amine dehydrogenase, gamma subunit
MRHLKAVNRKARHIAAQHDGPPAALPAGADTDGEAMDVVAMQGTQGPRVPDGPHIPLGCSFVFAPGWEVDSTGSTAGLCQPVERDLYDCYLTCFWPIHVPDLYNHAPDWTAKCAAAQQDWRKIDLIFP